MLYFPTLISVIEVVLVVVPALLTVAFVTVAEEKPWQVCKEDWGLIS